MHSLANSPFVPYMQGLVKYFTVLYYSAHLRHKEQSLRAIYVANQKWSTKRHAILLKWSRRFKLFLQFFTLMFIVLFIIFTFFPLVVYLVTGEKLVLFPVYLPGVDEETDRGFVILTCVHIFWFLQLCIGLVGSDSLFALMLLHMLPISELFEVSLAEMNDALRKDQMIGQTEYMKMWIRNLLQMHIELTECET